MFLRIIMYLNRTAIMPLSALMACTLLAGAGAGCGSDGKNTEGEGIIDSRNLADDSPDKPLVEFHCLTEDPDLNKFITRALTICQQGDYDGFRQLFASSHRPPEHDDFERIWHGVHGVSVESVHGPYRTNEQPAVYYVHAVIRLRVPDGRNRQKRDVVVGVFKEEDDWRLGTAPQGVVRKILTASTQPASAPATRRSP